MDNHTVGILDSWARHQRINIFALEHIHESWLNDRLELGSRTVGMQFSHMHQVRRMWLQVAAPDLWELTSEIDKKRSYFRNYLRDHLNTSSQVILQLLERGLESSKIKGFKAGPYNFMTYLVAHESHHRGQILLTLKINGRELGEELSYGLWDWSKR